MFFLKDWLCDLLYVICQSFSSNNFIYKRKLLVSCSRKVSHKKTGKAVGFGFVRSFLPSRL